MKKAVLALLVSAGSLVACGGGGGGSDAPAWRGGDLQGQWDGNSFSLLITPNSEFWGIEDTGTGLAVYRGTVTTSGTTFNTTFTAYSGTTKTAITATGNYTEKSSLSATSTIPNAGTSSFSASYAATYDTAPSLTTLAGAYHEVGGTAAVTIAANGTFTGTSSTCTFTGTATPDASGKNFYRMSVTYAVSGTCTLSGLTLSGVGIPSATALATALVTANGSTGAASVLAKN